MNILYCNPVGAIGGAEMCLLDLLASTRRARPNWGLSVILGDDGPLRGAVEALGVRCSVEPMPRGLMALGDSGGGGLKLLAKMAASTISTVSYVNKIRRVIRSENPDLLQTNGMKAHLLGSLAAPRGLPIVWHLHDYLGPRPAMARLLRLASKRAGISAVAVSHSVEKDARTVLGANFPVRAIHNAVDLGRFAPGAGDGPALDRASGLPQAPIGTVRVGLVATFARWKGHTSFFDAIAQIPADLPARFYIIGGPIYKSNHSQWSMDELKAEAAARGVLGRVGFVGHDDDPAEALRSLDIAIHASTNPEPFGRAIAEAMATGLAVVAMQEGGAAELFNHGKTALGCPSNDPSALANAIQKLIENPKLRHDLGTKAREAATKQFDANNLFDAWTPIYRPRSIVPRRAGLALPATHDRQDKSCPAKTESSVLSPESL